MGAETNGGGGGGLSKNNKSPPPHSGWRLNNYHQSTADSPLNFCYLGTGSLPIGHRQPTTTIVFSGTPLADRWRPTGSDHCISEPPLVRWKNCRNIGKSYSLLTLDNILGDHDLVIVAKGPRASLLSEP